MRVTSTALRRLVVMLAAAFGLMLGGSATASAAPSLFVASAGEGTLRSLEGRPGQYDLVLREVGPVVSFTPGSGTTQRVTDGDFRISLGR